MYSQNNKHLKCKTTLEYNLISSKKGDDEIGLEKYNLNIFIRYIEFAKSPYRDIYSLKNS